MPHNPGAERAVLAEALAGNPQVVRELREVLTRDCWHDLRHQRIWSVICAVADRNEPVDKIAVAAEGQWSDVDRRYLVDLAETVPAGHHRYHARLIVEAASERSILVSLARARQALESGNRAVVVAELDAARAALGRTEGEAADGHGGIELDAFLDSDEPEHDWLTPGLLERGDRLILTGREGGGKSTLLRQICMQLAAGLHPFTLERIDPLRVLLVDLENSEAHIRRQLRPLRIAAGDRYKPEPGLHLQVRTEGLNLLDAADARWLADLAVAIRPDVLVTGPIYKLAGGDPTEEKTARHVALWLDRVRTEIGCAVLLEAHAPYASNGGKRPERPYGASLWSRWPEFGVFLSPEGHLRHWRTPRDERDWPAALQRGGAWPWMAVTRHRDVLWAKIAGLCAEAGDQLSQRDLAEIIGASQATVHRVINEHRAEWDRLAGPVEEGFA